MHIKYLIKCAQTNRDGALKFTVINKSLRKPKSVRDDEEYRFKRFLGSEVNYTAVSFEEFARNPVPLL